MNTVQSEMSKDFITIGKDEKLESAYRAMSLHRIRHLPVMNDAKEICGILSDRDVQRGMTSESEVAFGLKVESLSFKANTRVGDYMSWPPKVVDQNDDLKEAARVMLENKISALLVVRGSDVVGIVTSDDMLRALIRITEDSGEFKLNTFLSQKFIGRLAQMASDAGI